MFQRLQNAHALQARQFFCLWKIYTCFLTPNCSRYHVNTSTNSQSYLLIWLVEGTVGVFTSLNKRSQISHCNQLLISMLKWYLFKKNSQVQRYNDLKTYRSLVVLKRLHWGITKLSGHERYLSNLACDENKIMSTFILSLYQPDNALDRNWSHIFNKEKKQNLCNGNQERVDSRGLKIFSLSHDRDMTKNIFHAEGCLIWKLSLLYLKRNFFEIIY